MPKCIIEATVVFLDNEVLKFTHESLQPDCMFKNHGAVLKEMALLAVEGLLKRDYQYKPFERIEITKIDIWNDHNSYRSNEV